MAMMGTAMAPVSAPVDIPDVDLLEDVGKEVDCERLVDVAGVDVAEVDKVLDDDDVDEEEEERDDVDDVFAAATAAWTSVKVMLEVASLPSLAVCVTW